MTPTTPMTPRETRLAGAGLFAVLLAVSARLLASALHRHVLTTDESPLLYHAATLGFDYFEFGFIRRGLGGSLVSLLGHDRLIATALFHLLSAVGLATAAIWLLGRRPTSAANWLVPALLVVALMGRWGEDPGRTDLCIAALLGGAAAGVARRRFVAAFACVAVGLAVHENGLVFGAPLLLALLLDARRRAPLPRRPIAFGLVVLVAALGAYLLLPVLPHADRATMVSVVRSRFPLHEYVDWAIYFAVSGPRGVATSICQNLGDPTYGLHIVSGLGVIALFDTLLRSARSPSRAVVFLASVPPFLFLCGVANDLSRWTVLAALNVWLLHAVVPRADAAAERRVPKWQVVLAGLTIALVHSKTWPIADPIFAPVPVLDRVVRQLGGPTTPRFAAALQRCDPTWREVLNAPPSKDR